jgi:hypothetical protein
MDIERIGVFLGRGLRIIGVVSRSCEIVTTDDLGGWKSPALDDVRIVRGIVGGIT